MAMAGLGIVLSPALSEAQERPADGEAAEPPAQAEAPPEEQSASSQERARALFMAGRAAIAEDDYEGAFRYDQESYELSRRPELLYNLANSAERLRRDSEAIQSYRQYLEALPDAENRGYVEARIRALEPSSGEPAGDAAPEPDAPPVEPPPSASGGGDGTVGWVFVGIGGAAAVLGAILVGVAAGERAAVDDAPDGAPWSDYEGSHSLANTLAPTGGIVLGVGVVAAVAGIVVAVTSGSGQREVALRVSPTGVALSGRFE